MMGIFENSSLDGGFSTFLMGITSGLEKTDNTEQSPFDGSK